MTTATGGLGNVAVSTLEDVVATGLSIVSIILPILVGLLMLPLLVIIIWFISRRSRQAMVEQSRPN